MIMRAVKPKRGKKPTDKRLSELSMILRGQLETEMMHALDPSKSRGQHRVKKLSNTIDWYLGRRP